MDNRKENAAYYRSIQRCARCGYQDAYTLNGRSLCADCAEKMRINTKRYYDANLEKMREKQRERLAQSRNQGLCHDCRKPTNNGKSRCDRCRAKHNKKAQDIRSETTTVNLPRGENGFCFTCNKRQSLKGKRVCQECYENTLISLAKARLARKERPYGW